MKTDDAEKQDLAPRFTRAPRVLIVCSPYYRNIAAGLLAGARAQLEAAGASHDLVETPGALEIAPAIRMAATGGAQAYDGYVALGCVIRGETSHYDIVCAECARGLTWLSVAKGLAIGNGVLTVETFEQGEARADPAGMDKGGGAARACLSLIAIAERFRLGAPPEGGLEEESILLA